MRFLTLIWKTLSYSAPLFAFAIFFLFLEHKLAHGWENRGVGKDYEVFFFKWSITLLLILPALNLFPEKLTFAGYMCFKGGFLAWIVFGREAILAALNNCYELVTVQWDASITPMQSFILTACFVALGLVPMYAQPIIHKLACKHSRPLTCL